MLFWTRQELQTFIEVMKDRPASYAVFMTLYFTGIREGELLALTPSDIDLEKKTLTVNKSYQRLGKEDIITTPLIAERLGHEKIQSTMCDLWILNLFDSQPARRSGRTCPGNSRLELQRTGV